jgi:hypothetical protein
MEMAEANERLLFADWLLSAELLKILGVAFRMSVISRCGKL